MATKTIKLTAETHDISSIILVPFITFVVETRPTLIGISIGAGKKMIDLTAQFN